MMRRAKLVAYAYLAFAIALSGFCVHDAAAQGVPLTQDFYQGVEVGTQSGFYESYDEAVAYWSSVPGVKSLTDACGPPPQMFSVVNDPLHFSGYGIKQRGEEPCMIWAEVDYIMQTDGWSGWARDQDRCKLVIHELGHTLGLEHKDYGDPSHIMTKDASTPAVCQASYPAPNAMGAVEAASTFCVPGWAVYGPAKSLDAYLAGHEVKAYHLFKRWVRKDRRHRARFEWRAADCQTTTYWWGAPAGK